jgi:hypothetical protein
MLFLLGFMCLWLSYDEVLINPPYRARYLLAVACYPALAWLVFTRWLPGWPTFLRWPLNNIRVAWGLAVVMAVFMGTVSIHVWQEQARLAAMITPESAHALDRIPESHRNIATNSFTMSLWVSALKQVDSPHIFTAPPPPAYREMDANMRCLLNWVEDCDVANAQANLGVDYILIDERFPVISAQSPPNYLAPDNQWERMGEAPWLTLVYSEGTSRLWGFQEAEARAWRTQ